MCIGSCIIRAAVAEDAVRGKGKIGFHPGVQFSFRCSPVFFFFFLTSKGGRRLRSCSLTDRIARAR